MAYEDYPYRIELSNIAGGLDNTELPQRIPINASPDLLNCRPLAADKWGQRNGIEIVGNRLSSAGNIRSIYNFKKPKLATETLIRSRDQALEYINNLTLFNLVINMVNQPANGETLSVVINGTTVTITFVSAIGSNPGNVLIDSTVALTELNLLALLRAPGTTNTKQVALTGGNQTLVGYFSWSTSSTVNYITGVQNNAALISLTASATTVGNTVTPTIPVSSWTAVPGTPSTFTQDLEFGFASDVTNVYYGNGVEPLAYWDGSINGGTTFGGTVIGNILTFYLKRLIVAGDPNNPATIYYSKTGVPTDFSFGSPRQPDDGGVLVVGDGGDKITSLKSLIATNGDSTLIVFKKSTRIYGVTFATDGTPAIKELKKDTGAINDRSTIILENNILYIDEDNNIQNIGSKQGIFNTLQKIQASNNLDSMTHDMDFSRGAGYYFKRGKFAVQCGKSYGSTTNNIVFAYYVKYGSWWLWTGINANQFTDFGGYLVWASSIDENVYRLGNRYDDLPDPTKPGNIINCYRDTKDIDLTEFLSGKVNAGQRRLKIPGVSMRYKQTRFVWIEGYMSSNGSLDISTIHNSDLNQIFTKTLTPSDPAVDPSIAVSWGEKVFGLDAFGGFTDSPNAFPVRHFLVRVSFDLYSALRTRIRISQSKAGAPFIIINVTPWMKVQPDEYFDDTKDL